MTRLVSVDAPTVVEWDELVAADPRALVTQSSAWASCVNDSSTHHDASRLYRFDDGRRILMPLARRARLPAAAAPTGSWPFDWGIGGPLTDGEVIVDHTAAVWEDLARVCRSRLTVRFGPDMPTAWGVLPRGATRSDATTYALDLPDGFDVVWRTSFRSSVRRAVRKAEKADIDVECDDTGRLVPAFAGLYRDAVRQWAERQHEPILLARLRARRANPDAKFRLVASRLGTGCVTWVARVDGVAVAAIVVLHDGRTAKYWRGAMKHELASPVRANDLLHRLAIEDACRRGATQYQMGDARPGSGLAAFKEGFGARPRPITTVRLEQLPFTAVEERSRAAVKRLVGFRDL